MKQAELHQQVKKANLHRIYLQQSNQSPRIKRTQSSHVSPYRQIKSSSDQINGRYHHSSILYEGKLYVYGGFDNDVGVLDDFKVFSCSHQSTSNNKPYQWQDISISGNPGPRHSHTAVEYQGSIFIFGGKVDRFASTNSIHSYNIKNGSWKLIDGHTQPKSHKNVSISKKRTQTEKQRPDNQNYSNQIFNYKPYPIDSHQSVVYKNQMIVFGGFANNQYQNDLFSFNFDDRQWKKIYTSNRDRKLNKNEETKRMEPQPRSDLSMVVYKSKLYIYAGKKLDRIFNDLWQFNLQTLQFRQIITSNPNLELRSSHSAVIYKDYMLIFGGISTVTNQKDDLLCYSFNSQKWITLWGSKNAIRFQNKLEKKVSSVKNKLIDNSLHKSKHEKLENNEEQNYKRKYRRPLAEQKQTNTKSDKKRQKQRTKKQNQRKYFLMNQLQSPHGTQSPLQEKSGNQQFNPLIQSLTNSIMMTSNAFNRLTVVSSRETKNTFSEFDSLKARKRLKARDGHTAHILGNQMVIFGGDRHMFAINDIVFVNLDYLMEIIQIKLREKQGNLMFQEEQVEEETHEK